MEFNKEVLLSTLAGWNCRVMAESALSIQFQVEDATLGGYTWLVAEEDGKKIAVFHTFSSFDSWADQKQPDVVFDSEDVALTYLLGWVTYVRTGGLVIR